MINQEEIKAIKEILSENKDSEIKIARSFLEDIVEYFEPKKMKDRCHDCGTPIKRCYYYCPGCGQAIDWSEGK